MKLPVIFGNTSLVTKIQIKMNALFAYQISKD